jgi:uncharacterized protein YprB with RNaseH-like and TPR domain
MRDHLGMKEQQDQSEEEGKGGDSLTEEVNISADSTDDEGKSRHTDEGCVTDRPALENERAWTDLGARPFFYEDQYVWIREQRIALTERLGPYRFEQLHDMIQRWNEMRVKHPLSARQLDVEQLLFFDTETTGLGGGAGNSIFLMGYSQLSKEGVLVKQYALPFPDCEVALYQAFLNDLDEGHRLVSYNGKAFDWPQVKTRHTLLRHVLPQLPSVAHFDLLHAARRLWKDELPSCRLQTVEQEILGIVREQDTPGYLAPLLYFEYLNQQDPYVLEGVLEHHQQDVLTLISLYIHLSKLLLDAATTASPGEHYQLAKWYNQLGEKEMALEQYERVIATESRWTPFALYDSALIYKQQGQTEKAVQRLERCCHVQHVSCQKEACIELAKLYEHRYHDAEKAIHYALNALELLQQQRQRMRQASAAWRREKELVQKRIERLEMKCGWIN